MDLELVNYSPGTLSHADYTTPDMANYRGSQEIIGSVLDLEAKEGLQGFMLLTHVGTDPKRKDKLYPRMDGLISTLKARGYSFVPIGELLDRKNP